MPGRSSGTTDPARRDRVRFPELRIVIARMGHPWFDEAIAVVRRHRTSTRTSRALVTRRWLLYHALVAAIEYRVEHKLLFGTDYPFFTAKQTWTACARSRGGVRPGSAGHPGAGRGGHHQPPSASSCSDRDGQPPDRPRANGTSGVRHVPSTCRHVSATLWQPLWHRLRLVSHILLTPRRCVRNPGNGLRACATSSSPIRRWVTNRTRLVSRSIARTPRSARRRRNSSGASPAPLTSTSTMFVSTSAGRPRAPDLRQPSARARGPPVVVRDPVDERVQPDERRGGRDARLVHARAAEPAQDAVGELDHVRAARQHRPHRRAEPLVQADRDRVRRFRERRRPHAERDRGVEEPRPVQMDVGAVPHATSASAAVSSARAPSRPRACACSRAGALRAGLHDLLLHLHRRRAARSRTRARRARARPPPRCPSPRR